MSPDRYAELYEKSIGPVQRYLAFKTGDPEVGADLAAEVFTRVWEHYGHLEEGPGVNLGACVNRTAYHLLVDHFRRKGRRQAVDLSAVLVDPAPTPEEIAIKRETFQEIQDTYDRELTSLQRRVLYERCVNGRSIRETAQITDRSEAAVRALQYQARRKMRDLLDPRQY
ncbi:RNA polymerase sigma factor [Candidatus Daviesbacteria bacterium]|nr:RNA polymerase sigma factor [Candidatus Daviesbacteria bacterium]